MWDKITRHVFSPEYFEMEGKEKFYHNAALCAAAAFAFGLFLYLGWIVVPDAMVLPVAMLAMFLVCGKLVVDYSRWQTAEQGDCYETGEVPVNVEEQLGQLKIRAAMATITVCVATAFILAVNVMGSYHFNWAALIVIIVCMAVCEGRYLAFMYRQIKELSK